MLSTRKRLQISLVAGVFTKLLGAVNSFPKLLTLIMALSVTSLCSESYATNQTIGLNPVKSQLKTDNLLIARQPSISLDNRISSTLIDNRGRFWVGTWQGLLQIDPKTGTAIASISLPNSTVTALLEDQRGYFWVGTTSGLYQIQPSSGKIENICPSTFIEPHFKP